MVDLETIEREIKELEARGDTTYSMCERLSWLYIVRDHLLPERENSRVTQRLSGSEFLDSISGVSYPALMQILNEHMAALQVVQPREYQSIMDKIKRLK